VGEQQYDGTRGIVYYDPSQGVELGNNYLRRDGHIGNSLPDVKQLVKKRSDESANLYSVLNRNTVIFTKDKNKQKVIKRIINDFSSIFTGNGKKDQHLLFNGVNVCDYNAVSQYMKCEEKPDIDSLGYESDEKLAQDIVAHALRNSLRRKIVWKKKAYYLPDIAVKLLLAVGIRADKEEYKLIPREEVLAFVGYVRVDRINKQSRWKNGNKITRQEDMVASIRKKDVKVQVFDKAGKHMLMLSNSENVKKRYVADFLKSFAVCADEGEQNQMIFQIRRLIVLFVYGSNQYAAFSDKNPWGKIPGLGEKADIFGDILEKDNMGNIIARKVITEDTFTEIANSKGKESNRAVHLDFDAKIRQIMISHYKAAESKIIEEKGIEDSGDSLFWISHFETVVEQFVKIRKKRKFNDYRCVRICNMLWEEWLSYIALKYMDLGKAVYYFGTPDLYALDSRQPVKIGPVQERYADGLTSFDYEKIKAEETLVRNFATAVTFAENAFSNAVVREEYRLGFDKREGDRADVLGYSDSQFKDKDIINENAWKRVMGYFGGAAIWKDMKINGSGEQEPKFLNEIRKHIANIRNANFHFSTDRNPILSDNNTYAKKLFSGEYGRINQLIGEKYLSNNILAFYPAASSVEGMETGLYPLMKKLYCHVVEREAQIPAFNHIIKKKDVRVFVEEFLLKDESVKNKSVKNSIFSDTKLTDKYLSGLYFLLKEIYYYGFLSENDLMVKFDNALKQIKNKVDEENDKLKKEKDSKDTSEKKAMNNFIKRYDEIKDKMTFGQMCQQIMTDYNMQNQKQKEVPSTAKSKWNAQNGNKPLYKHYVLILQQCIRRAFEEYLDSDEVFGFLKVPKIFQADFEAELISKEKAEEFIRNIPSGICLFEKVAVMGKEIEQKKDKVNIRQDIQLMYDWYVTAHFMSAKQINMLIGDIRSYKQYVNNIYERAKNTGNTTAADRILDTSLVSRYSDILSVLEFVLQFVGKTSRNIEDYFDTQEEYAKYIANYVDFDAFLGEADSEGNKYKAALQEFCRQMVESAKSTDKALGIYYDVKNPVPNRNMVYSLLYGDKHMLSAVMKKVRENGTFRITQEEIVQYYEMRNQLSSVFKRGSCISDDEQKLLKEFQNLKNRIELLDIQTYTELLNDIMAQMVSWAYLRERDLMYYQLGYHYVRLFYTDKVTEAKYHTLRGDKINIEEGALLYQIIALYDHMLPLYGVDKEGKAFVALKRGTPGKGMTPFMKEYCQEKDTNNPYVYYGGIRLFEDKDKHDKFVFLRDYIAHMKYHTLHDKSIWDLFGEMYNGFLRYDTKLKKSVSYISKNILERYFVVLNTSMEQGKGSVRGTVFSVEKITSDTFTYKYKDGNKKEHRVEVPCRSDIFLKQLEELLAYKRKRLI